MSNEQADALAEAIDHLATARANQRISVFVDNAEGAGYHAETAAKAKQVIKEILLVKSIKDVPEREEQA